MRKYHNIGIPAKVQRPEKTYIDRFGAQSINDESSFSVSNECAMALIATYPNSLKLQLTSFLKWMISMQRLWDEVLFAPNSPLAGIVAAFIKVPGAPIELLQLIGKNSAVSAVGNKPQYTG